MDDEFAFHLGMRARELAAADWEPAAARQEARRRFGDVDDARDYCRHIGERRRRHAMRQELFGGLRQDVAFAARALRRAPGFTLVAVLTPALGVGANVTMLGVVDRLLLRPPAGVRGPDLVRRLYFTETEAGKAETAAETSYPAYPAVRDGVRPAAAAAGFYNVELAVAGAGPARPPRASASPSRSPRRSTTRSRSRGATRWRSRPPAPRA